MIWFEFKPVDTLFFKGAVQMEKGLDHEAHSIFPPSPHTISGALRTTLLRQRGISISDYNKGKVDEKIIDAIGASGTNAPFNVIGPFIKRGKQVFIPTPFTWFLDKDEISENVYQAQPVNSYLIHTNSEKTYWAKGQDSELVSAGGFWIASDKLQQPTRKDIISDNEFFVEEIRTGNALQANRRVHEGRLYSFTHIRLFDDVRLVFAIDKPLPIKEKELLMLGGEQRFGNYAIIDEVKIPEGNSGLYMSLTILRATKEAEQHLVATGKLIYRGGWDLHKGFHKPMQAYYPAGTVFDQKINENMLEL